MYDRFWFIFDSNYFDSNLRRQINRRTKIMDTFFINFQWLTSIPLNDFSKFNDTIFKGRVSTDCYFTNVIFLHFDKKCLELRKFFAKILCYIVIILCCYSINIICINKIATLALLYICIYMSYYYKKP